MAGWEGEDLKKSLQHGRKPPRITTENGESYLIVNEPVHPISKAIRSGDESVSIVKITEEQERKPFRYHVYRSVKQTARDSEWKYCYHRVDTQAILVKTHESPRYLFRVVTDKSGGVNTAQWFQSEAVKQESRADMASMEEDQIKENLLSHMRDKKFPSHWISFTTSPVWAFDRALRLKAKGEKDVTITIIDTLHLVHPVRIFHTPALLKAYDLDEEMWPIMNRGAAEKLVWDELIAPGSMIPLDNFLKSYMFEGDRLKQGYSALQTFHFKPLDFANQSIDEALKVLKQNPVKDLYAPCHIRTTNFKSDADKQHEIEVRKYQAERTWREKYTAGRLFYGKKLNNWWDENLRVPISEFTVGCYLELIEKNFPPEFHFPVLIALLSTRLYHFEYSSVEEALEKMLAENDPLINPLGRKYECYVRDVTSPNLPELDAFEGLLRDCSLKCGLPVKKLSDFEPARTFLTLDAPYTALPKCDADSECRASDHRERAIFAKERMEREEKEEVQRQQEREAAAQRDEMIRTRRNAIAATSTNHVWVLDELAREFNW